MKTENGSKEPSLPLTFEALLARSPVAIHQVVARSSVLARVRETLVFVHFAVDANPACITDALIAARGEAFTLGYRGATES